MPAARTDASAPAREPVSLMARALLLLLFFRLLPDMCAPLRTTPCLHARQASASWAGTNDPDDSGDRAPPGLKSRDRSLSHDVEARMRNRVADAPRRGRGNQQCLGDRPRGTWRHPSDGRWRRPRRSPRAVDFGSRRTRQSW
jgi:hypothetical protein